MVTMGGLCLRWSQDTIGSEAETVGFVELMPRVLGALEQREIEELTKSAEVHTRPARSLLLEIRDCPFVVARA